MIESYETKEWSSKLEISNEKIADSEKAELVAESEREFIQKRKELIKKRLKRLNLSQQDFGLIWGHKNKSYISELMNGINPFSLKDLIVINKLLNIELADLIPTFLPYGYRLSIEENIKNLDNPKVSKELMLA